MARAGQIILFQFPQTDLRPGKLRPALIIGKLPGTFDDWLICLISSQLHHQVSGFDDVIKAADVDFARSGLKSESLIHVGRLAVVDVSMLLGAIGEVDVRRLARIMSNLANWLNTK
ncbi:MAG: type II toxin-antitoxin system PemK/MazF family toxin [Anaerolineae bacterium]|nr:type II toxin-antitoxin system PemK/MazF family toxin [Anaerolineae bacterium]